MPKSKTKVIPATLVVPAIKKLPKQKDYFADYMRARKLIADMHGFLTELMGSDADDSASVKDFNQRIDKLDALAKEGK